MLATHADQIEDAFVRHGGEVYAFLLRRTRNPSDAEELAQQVFVDAASALARSGSPRSMRRLLFTVAERRFIDELRRRARRAVLDDATRGLGESLALPGAVRHALDGLPYPQRQIILMRFVEERTYRDIARALDCNEAACKMRVARALRRLRDEFVAST
jgi:RNA polymerase sigma-70 factor (ECF subfamily)